MPYNKKPVRDTVPSDNRSPGTAWSLPGLSGILNILRGGKPSVRSRSVRTSQVQAQPDRQAYRLGQILARYDAVRFTGNRHRRLMDRGSEESEFRIYDRMYAISLGRDMHRNQARYVALERQIARMTAGTVKCQVNTSDRAWNAAAEHYFNKVFAKDCLLTVPRTHLSELCQQLVSSLIREGDVLVVFDDGFARDSGKLLTYEADQLVGMAAADFERLYPAGFRQEAGVILDDVGAIYGYITSAVRVRDDMQIRPNTLSVLPADKCLVYTTDQAVLLASRYRPGQIRGVPEMLPVSICLDDADEMVKSELLTSKLGAKTFATISAGEATSNAMADNELANAFEAQEAAGNLDPATGQIIDPDAAANVHQPPERPHYSSIDDQDSAIVTYLDGKDKLDIQTPTRPNLHVDEFYRARNADAAAALGLARGYAEMAVTNSYTAHRGESLLTWAAIYDRQKNLERELLDWLAEKVIARGIELGEIPIPPAEPWQDLVSWDMPVMPAIDEKTAADATAARLKSGLTTYKQELGSDWDEQFRQQARELDLARTLNLPLSVLETVSGAPAGEPRDNPDSTSTDE